MALPCLVDDCYHPTPSNLVRIHLIVCVTVLRLRVLWHLPRISAKILATSNVSPFFEGQQIGTWKERY